jgi:homocitrate synthase NifV
MHVHNDLGMAVANTVLGARGGALYLDTTIRGIGERAGNCDFYRLVQAAGTIFNLNLSMSEAKKLEEEIARVLAID